MNKKKRIAVLVVSFAIVMGVFAAVQFSTPYIFGADGNLHTQMATEIAGHGFFSAYPKASLSFFATRFSDKDFVYHIYLIPFLSVFGNPTGTKIAALGAVGLLTASIFFALGRIPIWAYPAVTVFLVLSPQFLRDMSESRPFTLAVALTIVSIKLLILKKHRLLLFVMMFYGMFHLSAWAFLVFAFVYGLVGWLTGKAGFQGFLYATTGFVVSFFLHPNFPVNIFYWYLNGVLVPWYVVVGNVLEVGAEFFPLTTKEVLFRYPMISMILLLFLGVMLSGARRLHSQTSGWLIASVVYLMFGAISTRNMTHAYPLLSITSILFAVESYHRISEINKAAKDRVISVLAILFVIMSGSGAVITIPRISEMVRSDRLYADHYRRVADYMKKNIPNGSRIFHTNWSDSQYLLGMAPEFEYLVTLDPIYMYAYNPELYWEYRRISHATANDPAGEIARAFKSKYGYTNKLLFSPFYSLISSSTDFTILAEDDIGAVFRINRDSL